MIISGESGGVSGSTISSLKEKLEVKMYGTLMKVVFWQALPDKGFYQRVKQCNGVKKEQAKNYSCCHS